MAATAGKRFNIIDKSGTKRDSAVWFEEFQQTELTPLAFAVYKRDSMAPCDVPETLVLSGIQGGGGGKTKKPRPKRL